MSYDDHSLVDGLEADVERLRQENADWGRLYNDKNDQCMYMLAEANKLRQENAAMKARFSAPIVCICGSTKFKQTWINENARLTGLGNIVLAVGLWGHHERVAPDEQTKQMLDDLHKRKIDLCDWVWVLDVNGYIGSSTRSEIEYATKLGKVIRYLSLEFPEYVEPVDPLAEENADLVTALDEATLCPECEGKGHYWEGDAENAECIGCPQCFSTGHDYSRLSPASRAVAERVLREKEGR